MGNEKKPNVILVHGAFEDAAALGGVVRELRMEGLDVRAPAIPLRGLASDAACTRQFRNDSRRTHRARRSLIRRCGDVAGRSS